MDMYLIVWIILAGIFLVLELVTFAFVGMYFALGAGAAAAVAALDGSFIWQLIAFMVAGIGLLLITRPVLKHRLEPKDSPTNVNRLIGKGGIVTIPIDNDANTGQIRVGTEYWTARLPDGQPDVIPVDSRVGVVSVQGVTARVELR